jgi:nitroimidazol reductase NimA-like FMN-containing flavoprotein (pyridoxamine 5'-phosphate oxidase superfamily)
VSNRRAAIAMDGDELAAFLDEELTLTCATAGPRGWPHLMPLWFVRREQELWAWTYGKSQKVLNLQRDPRATLQIEAGTSYDQLRGVMIEAQTTVHRDLETVAQLGMELMLRYAPPDADREQVDAGVAHQAPKRVALQFTPVRTSSFDHRKLAAASAS